MKNALVSLVLLLVGGTIINAQSDSSDPQVLDAYVKATDGLFYVLIPENNGLVDEAKANVVSYNEHQGLISLRVSHIRLDDFQLGEVNYLVVRRFDSSMAAQEYIKQIHAEPAMAELETMVISQANYRKFLKKKDLEEYILFLGL